MAVADQHGVGVRRWRVACAVVGAALAWSACRSQSTNYQVATILSYVSLRSPRSGRRVERFADLVFLAGLAVMVIASFLLAWQLGQSSLVAP